MLLTSFEVEFYFQDKLLESNKVKNFYLSLFTSEIHPEARQDISTGFYTEFEAFTNRR